MSDVEVNFYDAVTGGEYKIRLSAADALRAQTEVSEYTLPSCSSNSTFPMEETLDDTNVQFLDETTGEEFVEESFRWSHAAVLLLLDKYRLCEGNMSRGKISHKKAWDEISEIMQNKGYCVTTRQCSTRVNIMKRTFKSIKDHNGKSGNNKRTWPYYELMESLLGSKLYMTPVATASSTGAETSPSNQYSSSSSNSSCSTVSEECRVSRKRKASNIATAILESRKLAEAGREKRHVEKMNSRLQLMEKLDKLIQKL